MMKSALSTVALSALIAGSLLAGTARAQFGTTSDTGPAAGTPIGEPGVLIGPPGNALTIAPGGPAAGDNAGVATMSAPGIGPGMRGGVGAPTDGLDSNPYAEAPEQTRRALGLTGRGNQSARSPRTSGSGTVN